MGAYHDIETGRYIQTETAYIDLPLSSFVDDAGGAIGDFTSEDDATFGFDLANSEAMGIRWNNHGTPGAVMTTFRSPADRKPGTDITLRLIVSKVGATVGDATTFTVACFNNVVGALHDADTNFGGATSAVVGNAATKTVQQVTRTLASANLADGETVTMTLGPTAGTLGTDDILLHRATLEYERIITPV